ncbi:hypothetical protein Anas_03560, partial [Armadillidium nasatum]
MDSLRSVFNIILIACFIIEGILAQPNIVLVLTDDQDSFMNSISVMEKTLSLIGDKGVSFKNSFAATPLCCPSRFSNSCLFT